MDNKKNSYHKITVADLAPHVHVFLPNENKVDKIYNWLKNWIKYSLECNKIHPYDLLPTKADLACHIGVSQGTMQNVFRLLENDGLVESKQRIGTYIKGSNPEKNIEKLTSKREIAVEIIKNLDFNVEKIELKTLVEKVAENIKDYINANLKVGDRIPTNSELAKYFDVSVKTVHDAVKLLIKEGLLYSRRGQYGTVVVDDSSAQEDSYLYLKYEQKIRQYIVENSKIGDKLPSIKEFAKYYDISEKTIKKALDNLAEDGYITYYRGRYGGTFVTDIPQNSNEAYKWLAINADYMAN